MAGGGEVNQIAMEGRKRGSNVLQPRLQLVKPTVGALDGEEEEDGKKGSGKKMD